MKHNEHEKVRSLRLYHLSLAGLSVLGVLAVIFIDNWSEQIIWLPIAVTILFDGKFEKSDELAKTNTGRANSVTLWFMFAVMLYFAMFARSRTISAAMIVIAMFLAIAIRSVLFLILDGAFVGEKESDG